MPTTRPRHLITETDDIAAALDRAAAVYPGHSRADLLRLLACLGADGLDNERSHHAATVRERAGRHRDVYPDGYLDDLRSEWPE